MGYVSGYKTRPLSPLLRSFLRRFLSSLLRAARLRPAPFMHEVRIGAEFVTRQVVAPSAMLKKKKRKSPPLTQKAFPKVGMTLSDATVK